MDDKEKALRDLRDYGSYFIRDGKRVAPVDVVFSRDRALQAARDRVVEAAREYLLSKKEWGSSVEVLQHLMALDDATIALLELESKE